MDATYSVSLELNANEGKPRPGANKGKVTGMTIAYGPDYDKPSTSLSLRGTPSQNQVVIDDLVEQQLKGLKIESIEPGERRSDISISTKSSPAEVVAALRQAELISETESWRAAIVVQRTAAQAADLKTMRAPQAETPEAHPDPEVEAQRAIRRAP